MQHAVAAYLNNKHFSYTISPFLSFFCHLYSLYSIHGSTRMMREYIQGHPETSVAGPITPDCCPHLYLMSPYLWHMSYLCHAAYPVYQPRNSLWCLCPHPACTRSHDRTTRGYVSPTCGNHCTNIKFVCIYCIFDAPVFNICCSVCVFLPYRVYYVERPLRLSLLFV